MRAILEVVAFMKKNELQKIRHHDPYHKIAV